MAANLVFATPNTTIRSADVNANFQALSDRIRPSFVFTLDEILTVGTNKTPILIAPIDLRLEKVWAAIKVAPDGADLICDINVNGVSIWNSTQANRIKILEDQTSASTTAFDTQTITAGSLITLDVDQVGDDNAGETLTIVLVCS